MIPTFENYLEDAGSELKCPNCGGTQLQQIAVEVFERQEDCKTGLHAAITCATATITTSLDGNPSARLNALIVKFVCGVCDTQPELVMYHRKGVTWVDFKIGRQLPCV